MVRTKTAIEPIRMKISGLNRSTVLTSFPSGPFWSDWSQVCIWGILLARSPRVVWIRSSWPSFWAMWPDVNEILEMVLLPGGHERSPSSICLIANAWRGPMRASIAAGVSAALDGGAEQVAGGGGEGEDDSVVGPQPGMGELDPEPGTCRPAGEPVQLGPGDGAVTPEGSQQAVEHGGCGLQHLDGNGAPSETLTHGPDQVGVCLSGS